jgi:hypothetical protein
MVAPSLLLYVLRVVDYMERVQCDMYFRLIV